MATSKNRETKKPRPAHAIEQQRLNKLMLNRTGRNSRTTRNQAAETRKTKRAHKRG